MKVIEGFDKARAALARETPTLAYPVSDPLRQRLKAMFSVEDPELAVRQIVEAVRQRGDQALIALTLKIDGIKLGSLEVSPAQVKAAAREVKPDLVSALKLAAKRIEAFHQAQKQALSHKVSLDGLSQLVRPLARVGAYVPGGTATYPSTVLMTAIPARVTGVKEIVLVTPPRPNGSVPAETLVAAEIAGVDRVFAVGGAQAIAALAFGTQTIPKVDKICGPGNIFVTIAKKLVFGAVDIDGLAGPSEVVVIGDDSSDPTLCAADLLAQAEHDALSAPILITPSRKLAYAVIEQVKKRLEELSRKAIATQALGRGTVAIVASMEEAIELANLYAPEHLCLMFEGANAWLDRVTNAGCVVTGRNATVVLGDYVAGSSHVLPTGGTARFSSPLTVADFLKFINIIDVDQAMIEKTGKAASTIARAEGLDAHAKAIELRLKGQ